MKHFKICISAFLAVITLLSLLVSCGGKEAETENQTKTVSSAPAKTETEAATEPQEDLNMITLINEGKPAFSLKVQFHADEAAAIFRKNVADRYGCEIPDEAEYQIALQTLAITNSPTDWEISFSGSKLLIYGCAETGLLRAVEAFFRIYTNGDSKTLQIPEDISLSYHYETDKIDNSALLSYIPSDKVKLTDTYGNGKVMSPEWVDSLIMVELRPVTASIGGYLKDSYDLIDHYAQFGVNCIWLTPIYEYGPGGNGYGNTGPHKIGFNLTGTEDQEQGWEEMRKFVDYAHEKGVYVLFDVITWGVMKNTELTVTHPDWFSGEAWGNDAYNWKNDELYEWFISTCVDNIMKTGADGFRCDCEPNYTGYKLFGEVRKRLADNGKYVIIISEDGTNKKQTYDFEQDGVLWYARKSRGQAYIEPTIWYVDGGLDIVDSVKNGTGLGAQSTQSGKKAGTSRYYTNCITNHDYQKRIVCGNRLNIGYAAITAPFIPLWYMGDEFNAGWRPAVQYDIPVSYADMDGTSNRTFAEDVKKMIQIRRTYKDIFEYWPENHRDSNICKVELDVSAGLTAYARYAGNKAVLIIPNNDENAPPYLTATVPFAACGISGFEKYRVTDLWTGAVIAEGSAKGLSKITAYVPYQNFTMLLIEGI